ncbi:unnamed protein product [Lepidochelys olivacea]
MVKLGAEMSLNQPAADCFPYSRMLGLLVEVITGVCALLMLPFLFSCILQNAGNFKHLAIVLACQVYLSHCSKTRVSLADFLCADPHGNKCPAHSTELELVLQLRLFCRGIRTQGLWFILGGCLLRTKLHANVDRPESVRWVANELKGKLSPSAYSLSSCCWLVPRPELRKRH